MTETELAATLERYRRLIELSRELASKLDLNELLDHIVHAAADLCHAQAASILLYDESKQQLYFQAASNLESPLMQGLLVPVDASLAGWILTQRQPTIIRDTQSDPRHFGNIARSTGIETTSLLGIPLITKDKVIGVLEAINKLTGQFNEEDQNILVALGSQAAVAIENARLFQQSDLISELVHELRTPLASLNTASYLLLRPETSDEQRKNLVETIQDETSRLSEMTTSFLDLARLESGRTQFRVEQVNIKDLLEESATLMLGKADEKDQELNLEMADEIPPVSGDRDKLKQVVHNLLGNAIKYTPAGGKIILSAENTQDEVIIRVSDTGVGIPSENISRIFEKFFRVPGSEQTVKGTGLGLSICKRIVRAHKGQIDVVSEVNVGTTVTVHLPIRQTRGDI